MQKLKKKIKNSFLLIEVLNKDSLNALNNVFETHYTKKQVKKNVKIKRASKKRKFWDRLIKQKPGFNKRGGE